MGVFKESRVSLLWIVAILAFGAGCSTVPRDWSKACALQGHTEKCHALALSPDKHLVASGSWDASVRVWNRATCQCEHVLPGGIRGISDIAFLERGGLLAAIGWDGLVVWNTRSWKVQAQLACDPTCMAVEADGTRVLLGLESGELLLYDAARGVELVRSQVHESRVIRLGVSPDFKTAVSSHNDVVKVSIPELSIKWRSAGHDPKVIQTQIIVEPGMGIAISSSYDGTARVWDFSNGTCKAVLKHERPVFAMSLSPDGRRLLTSSYPVSVLWNTATWQQERVLEVEKGQLEQTYFSRDGSWVAGADVSGRLLIWDPETGKRLAAIQAKQEYIGRMIVDEVVQQIIVSGWGPECMIWNYRR